MATQSGQNDSFRIGCRQERLISRYVSGVDTDDVDLARKSLFRSFLPHRFDPKPGDFRYSLETLSLDSVSLHHLYFATGSHTQVYREREFYCIQLSIAGTCLIEQGDEKTIQPPGSFCVVGPRRKLRFIHPPYHRQLNVTVPTELFRELLSEHPGSRRCYPLEFELQALPAAGVVAPLMNFLRYLCQPGMNEAECKYNRLASASAERHLVQLALATLPNNYQSELHIDQRPTPSILARAAEFIHEHAREPISVEDIAAASGVSRRTLYHVCEQQGSDTPMRMLKEARLQLVRKTLLGTDRRSISSIAYDCGFNHLSRFAHDYAARYGELPSDTRKNRSGQSG